MKLGSVHELQRWLAIRNIRSKRRITRKGKELGNKPFSRGALFHLQRNRTYLGMTVHKDIVHPGMHAAIIDTDIFKKVQTHMDANRCRIGDSRNNVADAPLTGRIMDATGDPMSPTFSRGARGKLYRYYVSAYLQQGHKPADDDNIIRRIPAALLEAKLVKITSRITSKKMMLPYHASPA